jgi:Dockerin type I domain
LDNLKYGAQATTVTGSLGQYALDYLPAGTYTVRAIPPASFVATGALPSNQSITIVAGAVQSHVDFAAQGFNNPWQNPLNQYDVSNDTFESPIDALLIINDLNGNGARQLPSPGIGPQSAPPYLDVNGDGFSAPLDALLVTNRLNADGAQEPPDALGGSGGARGATSGGSQPGPDGEDLMNVMRPAATAANGQEPIHGLRRFTARGRVALETLVPVSTQLPTLAATTTIDDELALDVYRAWVKSRNAAAELEELAHDHSHDELDQAD